MHRCLSIEDIIIEICRSVALDFEHGRRTLSAIAQTCNLLCAPALDILWARMESLMPLLKCFPTEALEIRQTQMHNRDSGRGFKKYFTYFCSRPLVQADWVRFNFYAARVKDITLKECRDHGDNILTLTPALEAIKTYQPSLPLLPNLRRLLIHQMSSTLRHGFLFAPCPTLEVLTLELNPVPMTIREWDSWEDASDFLALFKERNPCLLEVSIVNGDRSLVPAVNSFVNLQFQLRSFICSDIPLTAETFTYIGSLRSLWTLWCTINEEDTSPIAWSSFPQDAFPALRELTLISNIPFALNLLDRVNLACLESFSLIGNEPSALSPRCLAILSKKSPSLTCITIIEMRDPDSTFDTATLRCLLVLQNLEHIVINSRKFDGIHIDFLKEAAIAWPRLRVLDLKQTWPWMGQMPPPSIFLEDVIAFATLGCLHLKKLRLDVAVCVRGNSNRPDATRERNTNKNIQCFEVAIVSADVVVVTSMLEVFPNLMTVDFHFQSEGDPQVIAANENVWRYFDNILRKRRRAFELAHRKVHDRASRRILL